MSEALLTTGQEQVDCRRTPLVLQLESNPESSPEPNPEPEPEPEPESEPNHPHPHPRHYHHYHHHPHSHKHHLSTACPPTPTTTTTTTAAMAALPLPLDLDQPLHSFAPFRTRYSQSDLLDLPLAVHQHTASASASASSPAPSSFASSTNSNIDGGEQDTSPSSAPSLLNDTSSSLPQTPSSANSHFRLDLHSTDFSASASAAAAALKQHQIYYPNPIANTNTNEYSITSGRSVFALFLAQRSPVLKLLNLPLDAPSFLTSLFTSTPAAAFHQPASFWTLATHVSSRDFVVWLVYEHHEQAVAALSSLSLSLSLSTTPGTVIVPALQDDLNPLDKLSRLDISKSPSSTALLRHRATAPSSMHQISLAQAQAQAQAQHTLPSIPLPPFSQTTTATPTLPRQNPRPPIYSRSRSPLISHSPFTDDYHDYDEPLDDTFSSKTKTPTVHPVRPRVQPTPPPHLPVLSAAPAVDDMADLSRIGVLRATASMGDLHSRGQLPSFQYSNSYFNPIAITPINAHSASASASSGTGTCTPNNNNNNNNKTSLGFTLSTNPPAPRATAFRQGDWMCTAPGCGAHNFGRNSACIGCGWARHQPGGLAAAATFGAGNIGGMSSTNINIGPRGGGMAIGLGMAHLPAAVSSGARSAVGNGIPRFAAASAPAPAPASVSTPAADVNGLGLESAIGNLSLSLHPSAIQALGGPGALNALQAAILAHQQQQEQVRGVVDRPKVPHATIHGNNTSNNGRDMAAAAAALNAMQALPGVGTTSASNGVPLLIPTMIAGSANSPMVPSNLPSQTQGLSTLQQQQLPPLQQQQNPILQTLTQQFAAATPSIVPAPCTLPSLLTPSGRQIAQGGTVRNVSGDDTNPIFMFWPDNEPLPEPGQCRPSGLLTGLGGNGSGPLPPILNTGNKGPIETQPGDWTCRKCEYLNWRRRRVCALCFPHAEGNSEGTKNVSSDVQERVTFLASLLAHQMQTQMAHQQQQVLSQVQQPQLQSSSLPTLGQRANSLPIGDAVGTSAYAGGVMRIGMSSGQSHRIHQSQPQVVMSFTPPPDETPTYHARSSQKSAGLSVNIPSRFSVSNAGSSRSGSYFEVLNKDAPAFTPLSARAGSFSVGNSMPFYGFDSAPGSGKPSPPSSATSRSSFAIPIQAQAPPVSSMSRPSTDFSVEEKTPSPLPLLPSFMHEMVGGDSSTHPSPSMFTDGWPSRRLTPSTEGSEDSHSFRSRSSIASSFGGVEYPQAQQRLSSLSQHRPAIRHASSSSDWAHDVVFSRGATTTASK